MLIRDELSEGALLAPLLAHPDLLASAVDEVNRRFHAARRRRDAAGRSRENAAQVPLPRHLGRYLSRRLRLEGRGNRFSACLPASLKMHFSASSMRVSLGEMRQFF